VGKKVPTLAILLPFSGVWGDKDGIWIPILKILVPMSQIFANAFI
jgi:hypothetical protein